MIKPTEVVQDLQSWIIYGRRMSLVTTIASGLTIRTRSSREAVAIGENNEPGSSRVQWTRRVASNDPFYSTLSNALLASPISFTPMSISRSAGTRLTRLIALLAVLGWAIEVLHHILAEHVEFFAKREKEVPGNKEIFAQHQHAFCCRQALLEGFLRCRQTLLHRFLR